MSNGNATRMVIREKFASPIISLRSSESKNSWYGCLVESNAEDYAFPECEAAESHHRLTAQKTTAAN